MIKMFQRNFIHLFQRIGDQFASQTKVASRNIGMQLFLLILTEIFDFQLAAKKRFYKSCSVVQSNGKFEVALDSRKLKTPNGSIFQVESEPLALAVAAEWDSQKEKIVPTSMHLVGMRLNIIWLTGNFWGFRRGFVRLLLITQINLRRKRL